MTMTDPLLTRRVEKVLPSKEGLVAILKQRKIRLYQGFDPTGVRLHVGHSVGLRKLVEFADAGHEVIFLFGTGTVLVGDPSQREVARKLITQEEIEKNIKDWKKQASRIVDFEKVTIKRNGDWLTKLNLKDLIHIASNISAVQLFKREMFQTRLARGDTVWYHETMYPLLQGYDSVAMDVDLEIGGTDQEFNMLVGRELLRKMKGKEKFVLTTPMILGTDGKTMSKTSGNCVWLNDTPGEMFGKLMRVPDDQIIPYMEFATNTAMERVNEIKKKLTSGMNPMDAKKALASTIVTELHGTNEAQRAKEAFEKIFQEGGKPEDRPVVHVSSLSPSPMIVDAMMRSGTVSSRGEAKRLIEQGAVVAAGQKILDPKTQIQNLRGTITVGSRRWFDIVD